VSTTTAILPLESGFLGPFLCSCFAGCRPGEKTAHIFRPALYILPPAPFRTCSLSVVAPSSPDWPQFRKKAPFQACPVVGSYPGDVVSGPPPLIYAPTILAPHFLTLPLGRTWVAPLHNLVGGIRLFPLPSLYFYREVCMSREFPQMWTL